MEVLDALAKTLKEVRKEKNMTQEMLAEKSSVHTTIIGRLEISQREPKISTLFKIVEALGLSMSEFMKRVEDIRSRSS